MEAGVMELVELLVEADVSGWQKKAADVVTASVVVVVGVGIYARGTLLAPGTGRSLTGVVTTALNVLTTNEQPPQSTELVEVMVERKTVLVASKGSSKTGCRVVHVDCADT